MANEQGATETFLESHSSLPGPGLTSKGRDPASCQGRSGFCSPDGGDSLLPLLHRSLAWSPSLWHRPLKRFLFTGTHLLEFKILWRKSNSHLKRFCDSVRCVCDSVQFLRVRSCSGRCDQCSLQPDRAGARFRTCRWTADVTSCWYLSDAAFPTYGKALENNTKLSCLHSHTSRM